VQLALAEIDNHGVLHVFSFLLGLIIGELVPPLLVLVITPIVLKAIVSHAAGDGRRRTRCRVVRFIASIAAVVAILP
jgi:hypothetical protein